MKFLTVDIGTGTQDILLFDSRLNIENGYKFVLPSPTMMVRQKLHDATLNHQDVFLSGVIMGGGPCTIAAKEHIQSGLRLFATPEAAKTFDDDLEKIRKMGIILVSEDECKRLNENVSRIEMKDFDFNRIEHIFSSFGVSLADLNAIAVAVFDHGNAPPEVSDRQFRFDYLDQRIRAENRLSAFAYESQNIPEIMTRFLAVAESAKDIRVPLILMDTAPAAILGATLDPRVARQPRKLILNLGNGHALAFRLGPGGIEGLFEHHTQVLKKNELENLVRELAEGTLSNQQVFTEPGHGALIYSNTRFPLDDPGVEIVVTGPRRNLLKGSSLNPYFAAPFGDMMLTGCFGLLAAIADLLPEFSEVITPAP